MTRKIDGQWIPTGKSPRSLDSRRGFFLAYSLSRVSFRGTIHKRSIVDDLFLMAQLQGAGKIFTEDDLKTNKNIHATMDNLLRDGYFEVFEDYGS